MKEKIEASELIINSDGSIFHLHLRPEQLADKVILVGDPGRVALVASHFESRECEVESREFKTVTGTYKHKRITVLSTGIGCDNIDIVMNELDALANVDFITREIKEVKNAASSGSLWAMILEAIIWGLAALVTPCVFPMIPMTVSFFMKGSGSPTKGRDAYYKMVFTIIRDSGKIAGCNFWGWSGAGRPTDVQWLPGHDYLIDPPHEPQGWYSVYDEDMATIMVIREAVKQLKKK